MNGELLVLSVRQGGHMESQAGLQMNAPKIFGRLAADGCDPKTAFVVIHPTSNFMAHYMFDPLQRRGRALLGLNTRYIANDTMLLMERAIQDLGAGIRELRDRGYDKIVLVGNSGGGALAAMYQDQAENLTIETTPDGRAIEIAPEDLPPIDGIALLCAHPGRAVTLREWIDAAVTDEADLLATDAGLDMYNPDNGPPYDADWLARYRDAQQARCDRLTDWVLARLDELADGGDAHPARDQAFVVYRTMADPRFLDLSLDANDREAGTLWGDARTGNYAANNIGRFTTLRSFLSQWSPRTSLADGPDCLSRTSVPVLNVEYSADNAVFPSQVRAWAAAAEGRVTDHVLKGAPHYLHAHPHFIEEVADVLVQWADAL